MPGRSGIVAALTTIFLLAGCGRVIPPATGPTPLPPAPPPRAGIGSAGLLGVTATRDVAGLGLGASNAAAALAGFRASCPRLLTRPDASGLTNQADWKPACAAARDWSDRDAPGFFARFFEADRIGDGASYVTGYYEPEIAGVRTRQPGFDVPVYGLPPDLVRGWPDDFPASERVGQPPLGRYDANGRFVAYYDRAAIEDGALAGKGLEIGWAADPVELFFLQVQGSGRLVAPNGSVMHIGFASTNGLPYTGIGAVMRDRGLIGEGPGQYSGSMQGIMRYLREHPDEGRALMRENQSWVFFREITGDGPIGALGVPVRARTTLAADPVYVPMGAPVWLSVDRAEAGGLWIVQDTGGAIKGANRFDSFWGAGAQARTIAGGMSARGTAYVLLPKGTRERLGQR